MTSQLWWYTARAGWDRRVGTAGHERRVGTAALDPVAPGWRCPVVDARPPSVPRRARGVFVAVHVVAVMFDSYVQFGLVDVLVPFAGSWHPSWVAWGIVSMYLLLAVEITSLTRRWLPMRVWRRIHVLSLPLFALATVHFVVAGTDSGNRFAIAGILISTLAVGGLLVRRIQRTTRPPARAGAAALRQPAAHPAVEGGPALEGGDERVAGLGAVVHDDVPEALGVHHELRSALERDPNLGRGVGETVGT